MSNEFERRKKIGTAGEIALRDLLTHAGAVVTPHQINRDATHVGSGTALAHGSSKSYHLPDLSVLWPNRTVQPRCSIEVKAKRPLHHGGWGWDRVAFDRAWRWSQVSADPVYYVIRDLSAAPLPEPGELDTMEHWWCASLFKLATSPSMTDAGEFLYWPYSDFLPLQLLLDGIDMVAATIAYFPISGDPPLLL